jgi:MerR family transcriptional regulator, light-induced transcriptional regulator
MPTRSQIFTPKQVARALGVSESSLKRWCDRGILPTVRTAGGHRRIELTAVLDYLRRTGRAALRPEVLGLPTSSGAGERAIPRAKERLRDALVAGDAAISRRVILDLFMAGQTISTIGDRVISPAFQEIGSGWECGDVEVYQERRACEIVGRVLHELETLVPQGPDTAPLAMGGTVEGDVYGLPTTLVGLVIRQQGWRSHSLGPGLPFATMLAAIRQHQPRLFWVSVSHVANEQAFLAEYDAFFHEASRITLVAVGGRALREELRSAMHYTVFCDRLNHLESFLATLPTANAT